MEIGVLRKFLRARERNAFRGDEDSTIINGYRRINKHYDSFHEASTQLVKRKLLADNDHSDSNHEVDGSKRCQQQ
ncbi:4301_t:CDS:2 [Diversispora eburnea]|uniref:4301_t:CDS:1 n=1 Tax=Diversispora eburnea TaxID=1213867 RepID=A0A9N8VT33_9GLOM|nr:4301_t:CDS:2 [Diversispora eburnea]